MSGKYFYSRKTEKFPQATRNAAASNSSAVDFVANRGGKHIWWADETYLAAIYGVQFLVGSHIRRYFGPLPPSRGVQRGPSTSVALQSTQLGAFTLSLSATLSYTPAGQTWA